MHNAKADPLIEAIRTRLSLNVQESSSYNGGMGDGPMYDRVITLQLCFDDEVISEVTL